MKKISTSLLLGIVTFSSIGLAMAAKDVGMTLNETDKTFITKATQGGLAEVEEGKLVKSKSQNKQVVNFADTMIKDHSKANDELKQATKDIQVTAPTAINSKQKDEITKLSQAKGTALDQKYLKEQITEHQETIDLFKQEIKNGQNKTLKAFASKTLPTIEHHLEMARKLNS